MVVSDRQHRLLPEVFKLQAVAAIRGDRSVSAVAAEPSGLGSDRAAAA